MVRNRGKLNIRTATLGVLLSALILLADVQVIESFAAFVQCYLHAGPHMPFACKRVQILYGVILAWGFPCYGNSAVL
jgi:hypothetical protein